MSDAPAAVDVQGRGTSSTRRLLSAAVGTSGLTGVYTLLLLVATIVLARWLGPDQYGVYALVTAIVVIVGHFATPGTENVLIRDISSYGGTGRPGAARALQRFAVRLAATASTVLVLGLALVAWAGHAFRLDGWVQAVLVGALIIPISALSRIRAATLVGLHQVVLARIPELVVRPLVLLVLVVTAALVDSASTAALALGLTVVAYAASYVVGAVLLRRALPPEMRTARPEPEHSRWLSSMPSFLALGFSDVLSSQMSITLIGWFGTARDAGVFAVANRGAGVVALGFAGVAAVTAPRIALLWTRRDLAGLDDLLRRSALLAGGTAAAAVLVLAVFREELLGIFGRGFTSGGSTLVILAVGQLVWAATGVRATALLMTGAERAAATSLLVSLVLTALLSAVLIGPLGQVGAATAWTISITCGQALTLLFWHRHRRSVERQPSASPEAG